MNHVMREVGETVWRGSELARSYTRARDEARCLMFEPSSSPADAATSTRLKHVFALRHELDPAWGSGSFRMDKAGKEMSCRSDM
jgi:hypothetical protein